MRCDTCQVEAAAEDRLSPEIEAMFLEAHHGHNLIVGRPAETTGGKQ